MMSDAMPPAADDIAAVSAIESVTFITEAAGIVPPI